MVHSLPPFPFSSKPETPLTYDMIIDGRRVTLAYGLALIEPFLYGPEAKMFATRVPDDK